MDEQYKKANIKGEFVRIRAGYFYYEVPVEFSGELADGKLTAVHKLMLSISNDYNKNVIEPYLKKEEERKAAEEKARIKSAELARKQKAEMLPEKPEYASEEEIPVDDELPDGEDPEEGVENR